MLDVWCGAACSRVWVKGTARMCGTECKTQTDGSVPVAPLAVSSAQLQPTRQVVGTSGCQPEALKPPSPAAAHPHCPHME